VVRSVYLNLIGDEADPVWSRRTARSTTGCASKRDWDPENVFRHNQNILPAD